MDMTPAVLAIRTRVQDAPEIVGLDPFGQMDRFRVACIAILVDLLLKIVRPDIFDAALTQIEVDARGGDKDAQDQLRWLEDWKTGATWTAKRASDGELPGLLRSGRELLAQLFFVASYTDAETGKGQTSTLYETLKDLEEEMDFVATACVIMLDIAFEDAKSAAAARQDVRSGPVGRSESRTGNGGGCYVATSVYGSYDCPEVRVLRRWRDTKLARTRRGRSAIRVYYALSPHFVRAFGEKDWFIRITKRPLDRFVSRLTEQGFSGTPYRD